ncbi:type II toxin-antitoxin system RelE/ParE family toxin [Candidatus Peregrinibacteria bacterium]|nr:type II toxin-antitoxin system RelE/ParE family toxin [Candidatus Peregrinibacteria bacterium]
MEKYVKFILKLPKDLRHKVILLVKKITCGNLKNLDIKPLVGNGDFYRCRFGKIRIIFEKKGEKYIIYDIGFRGNIYN